QIDVFTKPAERNFHGNSSPRGRASGRGGSRTPWSLVFRGPNGFEDRGGYRSASTTGRNTSWRAGGRAPARPVLLKLPQEAQVVGPELADVVDGVAQHGDALRAHAEGETAELCRVVAAVPQHDRMDHAGAHDLQPARLLAQ